MQKNFTNTGSDKREDKDWSAGYLQHEAGGFYRNRTFYCTEQYFRGWKTAGKGPEQYFAFWKGMGF